MSQPDNTKNGRMPRSLLSSRRKQIDPRSPMADTVNMTATEMELNRFNEFARQQLHAAAEQPTLHELMELWQLEHPSDAQRAEDVAALSAALDDFQKGDRGQPAGTVSKALRKVLAE